MKKIIALLLTLAFAAVAVSCAGKTSSNGASAQKSSGGAQSAQTQETKERLKMRKVDYTEGFEQKALDKVSVNFRKLQLKTL